ncbi:delta-aminolevulinic acid dehydratase [Thermoanaerobacterium sp. PSU-2]|uniref:porphobilinogen synthase n=1 Tax=Thermoanaerobacterium sp. PSU-2 TaxID=1930849 RepID=UPI000A167177|nr:porphobilinogen synthase [Thermoanaerobacterium sp. PSU-2]ORX23947.1 delta-aminolevulinic acid dehydratase [Thermoanaerobacterium sp. PSU-2]HHV73493.1 porphobilinogen synthase [Thermoanaerobacterium sp.]
MELLKRPRRLRTNEVIRRMVKETSISVDDLIYPMFVVPGENIKEEIEAMPGVYRYSVDNLVKEVKEVYDLRIPAVLLFGIPSNKDELGSEAYDDDGIIQKAVKSIKESIPQMIVITDVCMCEYTSHGHCGIVRDGYVQNDETVSYIAKIALSHVKAGADIVAPSDMMDGRVKAIRDVLDKNGYVNTPIISYSAKYASSFYGPFREAANSAPQFGDRKSYQMDPANSNEALREISLDIEEGADIIMVKPALPYLDIIRRAKDTFNIPIAAYNVSGEYSMIKAASHMGYIDEKSTVLESLTGIKRAGADIIITYFAKDVAKWLTIL